MVNGVFTSMEDGKRGRNETERNLNDSMDVMLYNFGLGNGNGTLG